MIRFEILLPLFYNDGRPGGDNGRAFSRWDGRGGRAESAWQILQLKINGGYRNRRCAPP